MKPVPKKRFGQHFLRDTGILNRIVNLLNPSQQDVFLEIGAGDGALSTRLAGRVSGLVAVEIDSDLLPQLQDSLTPYPAAVVVAGDILTLDIRGLLAPFGAKSRIRVAGNLPYNIATAVIERLLLLGLPFEDLSFLVQLEVARRITARKGTRPYGYFSVFCQHMAEVRLAFEVSPGSFTPRPRVRSAMVVFRPSRQDSDPSYRRAFIQISKAAFRHRRKTLANSLRQTPSVRPHCDELLAAAGIDGRRRAEDLAVAEFELLANLYLERGYARRSAEKL